jgi:hypothetical protein
MFQVYANSAFDCPRVVACCDDFNAAWEQAIAALDYNTHSEVRRADQTLWNSHDGYCD